MPIEYAGGWERAYENWREDLKCGDNEEPQKDKCNCQCHSEYDWYDVKSPFYWDDEASKIRRIIGPVQQVWRARSICCMDCDPPQPYY